MRDRLLVGAVVLAAFVVIAAVDLVRTWRSKCRVCGNQYALYPEHRCYGCYTMNRGARQ